MVLLRKLKHGVVSDLERRPLSCQTWPPRSPRNDTGQALEVLGVWGRFCIGVAGEGRKDVLWVSMVFDCFPLVSGRDSHPSGPILMMARTWGVYKWGYKFTSGVIRVLSGVMGVLSRV